MYQISDEKFDEIVESLGTKKEVLQEQAEKIQEWVKNQPHLPGVLGLRLIKNLLVISKLSTEVTKQKIDNYYSFRPKLQFFYDNHPKLPHMQELTKMMIFVSHEELYNNYRVIFFKLRDASLVSKLEPVNVLRYILNAAEIFGRIDIAVGQIFVFDADKCPVSLYLKLTPRVVYEALTAYEKICSSRLKGVFLLNILPIVEKVLLMCKAIMKPKLFERIHILNDVKDLEKIFPPEYLPEEFGGTGESVEKIQDKWVKELESYYDLFDEIQTLKVDENLRPEIIGNSEDFGYQGSFRKLQVD